MHRKPLIPVHDKAPDSCQHQLGVAALQHIAKETNQRPARARGALAFGFLALEGGLQ